MKKIEDGEKEIPDSSGLVTTIVSNTNISEAENKFPDNSKYISNQEFHKLTTEDFAARLKHADLVNNTDFDNKLTSFNKLLTSNKTKHL